MCLSELSPDAPFSYDLFARNRLILTENNNRDRLAKQGAGCIGGACLAV